MRHIITTMHVTIDAKTVRPDGTIDWVGEGPEAYDFDAFDRVDTCVLGRVMYPEYENYWRTIQADPTAPMEWSGQPPTPDEVRYAEDQVVIDVGVRPYEQATCPSNPPTPFVVELDEPLGDRTLVGDSPEPTLEPG